MMDKIALRTPGPGDGYSIMPVSGMKGAGLPTLQSIISWGTTALIIAAIILTIVFLILGGIGWVTSGGDKEKLAAARKKIVYAIIGLIITLGAFFIVNLVGDFFGIEFF